MSSSAQRARRRAWRSRLRARARGARLDARTNRAIAVERERSRRAELARESVDTPIRVAAAIAELAERRRGDRWREMYAAIVRAARGVRARVTVLQGDRLAMRAELLACRVPVVIDGVPVQSTARVASIVETSDTVIPTGPREGMPVTWVYDGDSIETYRRVVALRTKGGES